MTEPWRHILLRGGTAFMTAFLLAGTLSVLPVYSYPFRSAGSAWASETGADWRMRERQRFHEDTQTFSTTAGLSEVSIFGQFPFNDRWQGRIEAGQQEHTLVGPEAQPRIAAEVTTLTPRIFFKGDNVKARATLISATIHPQSSLYSPSGNDESLLLPGFDLQVSHDALKLTTGGWREFDLLPRPDKSYIPVVYQTVFVGLSIESQKPWIFGGQLGYTSRVIPEDLPQDRRETEVSLLRNDPLDAGEGPWWRRSTLRYTAWHYTLDGEDTLFLKWENDLRTTTGSVTHGLEHSLIGTDTYAVFREGGLSGSIVEVDKKDWDLQQRVIYTAWGRLGSPSLYWRAGLTLDHSMIQKAFLEFGLKAGITLNL